jgi:hypothetical protein
MLLTAALLVATLVVGLLVGDRAVDPAARQWFRVHFLLGVTSALMVMFVNGITLTYFIGTSRWCREVTETYALDPQWARRSAALKRRTFPVTLASMLLIVAVVALGGATDVQLRSPAGISWQTVHLVAALGYLAFLVYAALFQWMQVAAQQQVIAHIVQQVQRIRRAKGLDDDLPSGGQD